MGKMNPRTGFLDHIGSSAASSETEKVLGAEEREGDRDWEGEGSRQKEERGTRKREGELKARDREMVPEEKKVSCFLRSGGKFIPSAPPSEC